MTSVDSVLLIAFGGPSAQRTCARSSRSSRRAGALPPERLDEVAHHYELIGGRSPLNELTRRQAVALGRALAREGLVLPVHVGMRNCIRSSTRRSRR